MYSIDSIHSLQNSPNQENVDNTLITLITDTITITTKPRNSDWSSSYYGGSTCHRCMTLFLQRYVRPFHPCRNVGKIP